MSMMSWLERRWDICWGQARAESKSKNRVVDFFTVPPPQTGAFVRGKWMGNYSFDVGNRASIMTQELGYFGRVTLRGIQA